MFLSLKGPPTSTYLFKFIPLSPFNFNFNMNTNSCDDTIFESVTIENQVPEKQRLPARKFMPIYILGVLALVTAVFFWFFLGAKPTTLPAEVISEKRSTLAAKSAKFMYLAPAVKEGGKPSFRIFDGKDKSIKQLDDKEMLDSSLNPTHYTFAVSHDGEKMAVCHTSMNATFYLFDLKRGDIINTRENFSCNDPEFSPDNQLIFLNKLNRNSNHDAEEVSAKKVNINFVTLKVDDLSTVEQYERFRYLKVSSDGKVFYFRPNLFRASEDDIINILNIPAGKKGDGIIEEDEDLKNLDLKDVDELSISPDGNKLVYRSKDGYYRLLLAESKDKIGTRLFKSETGDKDKSNIFWSQDEQSIFFIEENEHEHLQTRTLNQIHLDKAGEEGYKITTVIYNFPLFIKTDRFFSKQKMQVLPKRIKLRSCWTDLEQI